MPLDTFDYLPDLNDFLNALRTNGIPIGPSELERLRQLFERQPQLNREQLKTLISALLIKTSAHQEIFEPLFNDWCPESNADWSKEHRSHSKQQTQSRVRSTHQTSLEDSTSPEVEFEPESVRETHPTSKLQRLLTASIALVLVALLWFGLIETDIKPDESHHHTTTTSPTTTESSANNDLPATPVPQAWFWHAKIDIENIRVPWRLGPIELALLALLALLLNLFLWHHYRQRFPEIKPIQQHYRGYRWQPLPSPQRDDSALIESRQRRQLVWNIERFVTDDLTRRLDLPQTVAATANTGGYTELRFEPAVYEREIWFWLDRQLDLSSARHVATQLQRTLSAAGLTARQGLFTDIPERIDWPHQTGYRPLVEEGQGRQSLVAIFTDGEGLANRLLDAREQKAVERLLRSLKRWPRLCFVDCGLQDQRLAGLLEKYAIEVIQLDQLAQWLGGIETTQEPAQPLGDKLYGEALIWAAALVLGGEQTDEAAAYALRFALNLSVSPWLAERVLDEASKPDHQLALINFLLHYEPANTEGFPRRRSYLYKTLAWWQTRYREAAQTKQTQENPLLPWHDSLAGRRWQLEQALLRLYIKPEQAANTLTELADDELRDEIHERLAVFATSDMLPANQRADDKTIRLTWRFRELPAMTRQHLRKLGFAEVVMNQKPPPPLKSSPKLVLALTLLTTLALTAIFAAGYKWWTPDWSKLITPKVIHNDPVLVKQTIRLIELSGYRSISDHCW